MSETHTLLSAALGKLHCGVLIIDSQRRICFINQWLLQALRGVCGTHTPAVLVTADGSDAVKRGARELGIPVLTKPVKPASLRAFLGAQRRSGGS